MADKGFSLSIIIRTIDQATAGIKKIHDGIEHNVNRVHAPVARLGAAFTHLGHAGGIHHVAEGFKKVGEEAHEFGKKVLEAGKILAEFSVLGAGLGVETVLHLIEGFSKLALTAKIVGLTVDELSQLRFAAEQAGVGAEEFDSAFEKFNKNLGEMKSGGGAFLGFLNHISPALAKQIKAAKSGKEAFLLYSDAMRKVTDPTKRALLATKAFGKAGQPLVNMLANGADSIREEGAEYEELAGSQEGAAEAAMKVHHAMGRLNASVDGVKAAIVVGLGPAFEEVVGQMKAFFVENRGRIAEWVKEFGQKLPGVIHSVAEGFMNAVDAITPFWNAIGGLKGAAEILAVVLGGKLLYAVAELTVALLLNPFGLVIVAVAALIAIGVLVVAKWDYVKGFFVECWNVIKGAFSDAWDFIKVIVDKVIGAVDTVKGALGSLVGDETTDITDVGFEGTRTKVLGVQAPGAGAAAAGGPKTLGEARIKVDFANAPKGTRISADPKSTADVDLSIGYQMGLQ